MPKRIGSGEGKRTPLNMRTTQKLRAQIEAAAAQSGRSLTQEVEFRLEQSFGFGSDLGALIQKAVADGIAAHESAKREDLLGRVVMGADGSWSAVNQPAIQTYRY